MKKIIFQNIKNLEKYITQKLKSVESKDNEKYHDLVNLNLLKKFVYGENLHTNYALANLGNSSLKNQLSYESFFKGAIKSQQNNKYLNVKSLEDTKFGLHQTVGRFFSSNANKNISGFKPSIEKGGDFGELVSESSIFADKSLFIKEVIEDSAKVILITMPRRWGKSLNLDMLRRFLSIEEGDQEKKEFNRKIFAQKIKTTDTKEKTLLDIVNQKALLRDTENIGTYKEAEISNLQGQSPVIFIDFKGCKSDSLDGIESKLKNKIYETVRDFSYLKSSQKIYKEGTIGEEYITLLNSTKNEIITCAIKELSSLLHAYHGKKVWILIDEYDAPLNQAYLEFEDKDAKKASVLFRDIYESSLKGNEHLEKGVMTGVQYIVKSGMLSGLNNISKYNVTSAKYSKYYGLDEGEMKLLLDHFGIKDEKKAKIKDWYNGYKLNIGTAEEPNFIDKYNIWSVVGYLNNQSEGFKGYWEESGLGEIIDQEILKHDSIRDIVKDLVDNKNITLTRLITDFNISDFKILKSIINNHTRIEITPYGVGLLFSYLFILGYLTNTSQEGWYKAPNKEIRMEFNNKIVDYYNQIFNISPALLKNLTKDIDRVFLEKDKEKISDIFISHFAPKLSSLIKDLKLYDNNNHMKVQEGLFANEDLMHSLLNNIALQVVNAKFASERHTTKIDGKVGRADIVLEKNNKGILIEMKYHKGAKKDSEKIDHAKEALEQAESYSDLLKNPNIDTKIFVGCSITDQQEVFLAGKIEFGSDSQSNVYFNYPDDIIQ